VLSMLLSNRFHELSISLENQFDAISFGRSLLCDRDLTTKLTTRALCERVDEKQDDGW
jgi:hypothetical protein